MAPTRLTPKQAAQTRTYAEARANGSGITDAIASARWSNALRRSVQQTFDDMNRRAKAAKKGWKTRRAAKREA